MEINPLSLVRQIPQPTPSQDLLRSQLKDAVKILQQFIDEKDFEVLDENNPHGQILVREKPLVIHDGIRNGRESVVCIVERRKIDDTLRQKLQAAQDTMTASGIRLLVLTEAVERPFPSKEMGTVGKILHEHGFKVITKDDLQLEQDMVKVGDGGVRDGKPVVQIILPGHGFVNEERANLFVTAMSEIREAEPDAILVVKSEKN